MSFWDKMAGFFNKYGGRNGTEAASNYHSNSYGTVQNKMGSLGSNYGTYNYNTRDTSNREKSKTGNPEINAGNGRSNSYYEGNTHTQMTNFVNKAGNVNRTQNRESGNTGNAKHNSFYENKSKNGKEYNLSYPANYDAADTQTNGQLGKDKNGKTFTTPMYGNKVYDTNYNVDDSFISTKWEERSPLKKHNYHLENGRGKIQTVGTYDPNWKGDYEKASKKIKEENKKLLDQSKGPSFLQFDIEQILETNGITTNRLKNKLLTIKRININRTPSFSEMVNYGKQYIFFSKPDLNLFIDNSGTVNPSIKQNCPDLYMKIIRNPLVAQQLQSSFGGPNRGSGGGIITQLSNMCNECAWPDMGISKKEGAKNIKGQGISYGGDFFEATDQQELNISFLDNRDRDIQILFEIWCEYIEGVNNGTITKKSLYISNNTVDYAINIWVMTLDESYNILSWGMAGACFPLSVSTDLLNYSAVPKTAAELAGPFQYKWHVSYFHKPNMHRTMEMFNYATGFKNTIAPYLDATKSSYQFTHTQVGNYWIHAGFIPYHTTLFYGYEYHFNIEDKMAEMVGVHISYPSSGITQYSLVFASVDVGPSRKPGEFGTNEYNFYKFDDDIEENVRNWQTWTAQHPNYYKNPMNKDVVGTPLWNQDQFNPDYQAWLIAQGGRSWNQRFNRGYNSSNNRFGAFSGSSNSKFFSGAVGQIARAFGKIF